MTNLTCNSKNLLSKSNDLFLTIYNAREVAIDLVVRKSSLVSQHDS